MNNTAGRCVLGTRVRFNTSKLRYICFAVSYQHLLVIPKPRQNCILHIKFFLANDDKWGRYMYMSYSEHLWYLSLVEYSPWSTIIMCLSSPKIQNDNWQQEAAFEMKEKYNTSKFRIKIIWGWRSLHFFTEYQKKSCGLHPSKRNSKLFQRQLIFSHGCLCFWTWSRFEFTIQKTVFAISKKGYDNYKMGLIKI